MAQLQLSIFWRQFNPCFSKLLHLLARFEKSMTSRIAPCLVCASSRTVLFATGLWHPQGLPYVQP